MLARSEINRLLEPGYLDGETGYRAFEDGSGYVASLVKFPGVAIEALRWWWWWHSVESERYLLWFPHQHVEVVRYDRDVLENQSLSDEERYVGSSHHVTEFIGPYLNKIQIDFREPSEFGLDGAKIAALGIVHGCGFVSMSGGRVRVATMIHLARPTEDGFEMRSRYWMGSEVKLRLLGREMRIEPLAKVLGVKKRLIGARMAYEQLLHDQTEFTHLSSFLGPVYAEFGPQKSG